MRGISSIDNSVAPVGGELVNRVGRAERIREPDERLPLAERTAHGRGPHREEHVGALEDVRSAEHGRTLLRVGVVGETRRRRRRRVSTATSTPAFLSAAAPAGITATRVSPGQVSFGIPTLMAEKV